jgi:hypothetical protein
MQMPPPCWSAKQQAEAAARRRLEGRCSASGEVNREKFSDSLELGVPEVVVEPGELVVRLLPERVIAKADVAGY